MFRFELSEQMTAVIANALGNHPFREAAPVINEIQRQINNQRPMPGVATNGKQDQQPDCLMPTDR
jgi:hypothetical protein